METFTRQDDVVSVLADPRFAVPSPGPAGAVGTMSWLRAGITRFSNGPDHLRRRALVADMLDGLDLAALRRTAREHAAGGMEPSRVPVAVLASALGGEPDAEEDVITAVTAIAADYHPPSGPDADWAVAELLERLGPGDLEMVAGRICVLVQTCDATAGLIRAAVRLPAGPSADVVVAKALRDNPPVHLTRRECTQDTRIGGVAIKAGEIVALDLAAARLPFGAGPRPCPGSDHALALACGVVEGLIAK